MTRKWRVLGAGFKDEMALLAARGERPRALGRLERQRMDGEFAGQRPASSRQWNVDPLLAVPGQADIRFLRCASIPAPLPTGKSGDAGEQATPVSP